MDSSGLIDGVDLDSCDKVFKSKFNSSDLAITRTKFQVHIPSSFGLRAYRLLKLNESSFNEIC